MQKSEKERAKNMRKKQERASKSEKERGENESNTRLATSLTRYERDTYLMVSKVRRRVYRNGDLRGQIKGFICRLKETKIRVKFKLKRDENSTETRVKTQ